MRTNFKPIVTAFVGYGIPIGILTGAISAISLLFAGIYKILHNLIFMNCADSKTTCLDFYGYDISLRSLIQHFNPNLNGLQMMIAYGLGIVFIITNFFNILGFFAWLGNKTGKLALIILKSISGTLLKAFKLKKYLKSSPFEKLLSIYISFLKMYVGSGDMLNILRSHLFFLRYSLSIKGFPTEGKEFHLIQVPFEYRNMIKELDHKLGRYFGDSVYIKGPYVFRKDFFSMFISDGTLGFEKTKAILLGSKSEFTKLLPGFDAANGGSPFEMDLMEYKEDIKVRFYNLNVWKIRNLDLDNLNIPKGHFLAGFYPELSDDGIVYKDYYIPNSSIIHSFIVGGSTNGKDILMNNFIVSIINDIRHGKGKEIIALDAKTCDWEYLENLTSYGIHRTKDIGKFIGILEGLQKEMFRRQNLFGIHSKLSNYLEANPHEKGKMKEVYIVINEIFALFAELDSKDSSKIASLLVSILSKGAGAGLHIVLLGQSIRKSTDPEFAKILVNISSRFSVKVNNKDEAYIAGAGLSTEDLAKLKNLIQYNCMHIDSNMIRKEFRAYYLTQLEILDWIKANFKLDEKKFSNPKIQTYFMHSKNQGKLSFKEAQDNPFNLIRSEWDDLVKHLDANDLIIRNLDNSISFKNPENK